MSPTGLQTAEETAQGAAAARADSDEVADPTAAPARTRRLLRAVEHYKAAQVARREPPREDESWLVLLTALASPDAAEE
jgi:cell division septation protein DedD